MKNRIKIKVDKTKVVYIFQFDGLIKPLHRERIRQELKQQIEEGCVLLDHSIQLVNPKPRRKGLGKPW